MKSPSLPDLTSQSAQHPRKCMSPLLVSSTQWSHTPLVFHAMEWDGMAKEEGYFLLKGWETYLIGEKLWSLVDDSGAFSDHSKDGVM